MMGQFKGVGPRINRLYPKAVPLWCTTHQLNRVIVQSSKDPPIRNMIGTVDSVSEISYFCIYVNIFIDRNDMYI